jgi:osmotically-inducible protein OsmY
MRATAAGAVTRRIAFALLLGGAVSACAAFAQPDARDARITAEVKAGLAQYAELQAPNSLDVQTLHQVVYLRGLMGTPFEASLASSVAARVSGVRRVENLIGLDNSR